MLAKDITSICKIRVLLVPVAPIKKSTFDRYAKLLQEQCQSFSLGDVTPKFNDKVKFNTQTFQEGQLHFQFQTEWTHEEAHLQDFQPYRRLFGVIGIMDCQEWDNLSIGYHQFEKSLSKYPTAIATRCFAFDPIETQEDDTKGLIMIPNVGNISFYMTTMICDFASDILEQLESLAHRLESLQFLESPNQTNNEPPTPIQTTNHRFSYPASISPTTTSTHSIKRHSLNLIMTGQNNLPSSPSTPTPTMSSMKTRRRTPGRIQKLLGDLYLLAGLLPDAIQHYNTAIEITRSTSDHLWLASALEGWICALILLEYLQADMSIILSENRNYNINAFSEPIDPYFSGEMSPEPPVVYLGPWSILTIVSERYETILSYYTGNGLIYSEACLRISRFLTTVYLNRGCHEVTFNLLVQGKLKSKVALSKFYLVDDDKVTLTKLKVSEWIMKVWDATDRDEGIGLLEKIHICIHTASLYSILGYQRKHAWLLNEALEHMMTLVLRGEKSTDRHSILYMLRRICEIYGIQEPSSSGMVVYKDIDQTTPGWPSLQIDVLRKCISVSELLQDDRSRFYYTSFLLRKMSAFITRAEKIRLATMIQGMIINSKCKKSNLLHYWGYNILSSIQCDKHACFIQQQQKTTNKRDDPFIYSPFLEKAKSNNIQKTDIKATLSKNEPCEFQVTLINPFGFELEIQDIRLSTSGASFIHPEKISPFTIPANDILTLEITGVPNQVGSFIVRGCLIQIAGFEQQEFLLEYSQQKDYFLKLKKSGLNAIKYNENDTHNDIKKDFLHFNIIDDQPIVDIKSTSHPQNAISLFEGETTPFTIEIENIGNTLVNFINIHFDVPANKMSHTHLLSLEEQYELEYFDKHEPVFSCDASFRISKNHLDPNKHVDLKPGETTTIHVNIFGKRRDCKQGTIRIGYGNFQPTETGHHILHYLYVDVTLSVYPLLEIFNWDMIHLNTIELPTHPHQANEQALSHIKQHYEQSHDPDPPMEEILLAIQNKSLLLDAYCWLSMDIKNAWTSPFDLYISAKNEENIYFRTTVFPLSTSRIMFPLKRILLPVAESHLPIPLSTNDQYIFSNNNDKERLKQFWYRQYLLDTIQATWKCKSHSGVIPIRSCVRLSPTHLAVLKLDDMAFTTLLVNGKKLNRKTFSCKVESEVILRLEIENRLGYKVKSILRLQSDRSDQVLISGNKQMVLPEFSETYRVQDIPLYFLSKGQYNLMYHLEDVSTKIIYQNKISIHVLT